MKNFGKQSVPNGPLGGVPAPFGSSQMTSSMPVAASAAAAMALVIGTPDEEIARKQKVELQGKFTNLDDEDDKETIERKIRNILNEYIHSPDVKVRFCNPNPL